MPTSLVSDQPSLDFDLQHAAIGSENRRPRVAADVKLGLHIKMMAQQSAPPSIVFLRISNDFLLLESRYLGLFYVERREYFNTFAHVLLLHIPTRNMILNQWYQQEQRYRHPLLVFGDSYYGHEVHEMLEWLDRN